MEFRLDVLSVVTAFLTSKSALMLLTVSKAVRQTVFLAWPEPVLTLSEEGAKKVTSSYFLSFKGKLTLAYRDICRSESVWMKALSDACRNGLRLGCIDFLVAEAPVAFAVPQAEVLKLKLVGELVEDWVEALQHLSTTSKVLEVKILLGCKQQAERTFHNLLCISKVAQITMLDICFFRFLNFLDLLQVLPQLSTLRSLDISHCMTREEASEFAKSLPYLSRLEHLELRCDSLQGWEPITVALESSGCVKVLNDRKNYRQIMTGGLETITLCRDGLPLAMAVYLPRSAASLTWLDLSKNEIGDNGATAMAPFVRQLTNLRGLILSRVHIGDAGATAVAGCLPNLTKLKTLLLTQNRFSDPGVLAIARCIPSLPDLRAFFLEEAMHPVAPDLAPETLSTVQSLMPTWVEERFKNRGLNFCGSLR